MVGRGGREIHRTCTQRPERQWDNGLCSQLERLQWRSDTVEPTLSCQLRAVRATSVEERARLPRAQSTLCAAVQTRACEAKKRTLTLADELVALGFGTGSWFNRLERSLEVAFHGLMGAELFSGCAGLYRPITSPKLPSSLRLRLDPARAGTGPDLLRWLRSRQDGCRSGATSRDKKTQSADAPEGR